MKLIKDKSQALLFVIAAILFVINILLIFQNLHLRSQLNKSKPAEIEEGNVLNAFHAKDLDGKEIKIDFSEDNKRILLFFRTTCGYSQKQMPYWKDLIEHANRQKYKITVITTEIDTQAIRDYVKNYRIEDWEVLIIDAEDAQEAKLLVTPITIVVDNKGVVEKVWAGMWQTKDIDSASKYFALNFSEIRKAK